MKPTKYLLLSALFTVASAHAVPIAIIDSGTDLGHDDLRGKAWVNANDEDDAVDNDDNGYIDDTHGWNFAENDNRLFDRRLIGTFSADVYKFFEIQGRMLNGTASPEDLAWMQAARSNPEFISELGTFGNFVHGSHVAGIAAQDSTEAKIMPLKLIPTKAPKPFAAIEQNGMIRGAERERNEATKKKLVLMALEFLAKQQSQVFAPISAYTKNQGAKVANCSFGTSTTAAKGLLGPLLKLVFKRDMTEAELNEYAGHFVGAILKNTSESFVAGSKGTLFVMAAGNDGTDNDVLPTSPANIKAENTITVAATNGLSKLASFSNYGAKMVDVAAPGVAIRSTIPGNEHLLLSGTSQAAPFVANIAGQILDMNPKLTPAEVRQILMATSDKKDFLVGKVASQGIANTDRAVRAARLSATMSLEQAITRSRGEVRDQEERKLVSAEEQAGALVLPLPNVLF